MQGDVEGVIKYERDEDQKDLYEERRGVLYNLVD